MTGARPMTPALDLATTRAGTRRTAPVRTTRSNMWWNLSLSSTVPSRSPTTASVFDTKKMPMASPLVCGRSVSAAARPADATYGVTGLPPISSASGLPIPSWGVA